jgi:hypothetical protein
MTYKIRKLLIVLIILLPVVSYSGCKKQSKCGCSGDVIQTLDNASIAHSSVVYNDTGTNAYFVITSGYGYDTYYFCNPSEMYAKYKSIGTNDPMQISGDLYWDCTYVSNASNSSSSYSYSYSYYKSYDIHVTSIESNLYQKK